MAALREKVFRSRPLPNPLPGRAEIMELPKFIRVSMVIVLTQSSPPGQPFTFGGSKRSWPIRRNAGSIPTGENCPGSALIAPTMNSAGLFTVDRYASGDVKEGNL